MYIYIYVYICTPYLIVYSIFAIPAAADAAATAAVADVADSCEEFEFAGVSVTRVETYKSVVSCLSHGT